MVKPSLAPGLREPTQRPLSWQALDVLAVIRSMDARPTIPVDASVLWHRWGRAHASLGNASLWQGLRDLVDAGLVEPFEENASAIFITESAL